MVILNSAEKKVLLSEYCSIFKAVPFDKLSKKEKRLADQCTSGRMDFSEKEMETLKNIAIRYQSVKDFKADEILDNVDEIVKTIKTEEDLIAILDKEESKQELIVNLRINGETYRTCFEVLPMRDSSKLQELENQAGLFADFDARERNLVTKGNNNPKSLTLEEKEVYENLVNKINEKSYANSDNMILVFLANQLKIKDIPFNYEQNLKLWSKVDLNVRVMVFYRVQDMLGLNDITPEELFPTS